MCWPRAFRGEISILIEKPSLKSVLGRPSLAANFDIKLIANLDPAGCPLPVAIRQFSEIFDVRPLGIHQSISLFTCFFRQLATAPPPEAHKYCLWPLIHIPQPARICFFLFFGWVFGQTFFGLLRFLLARVLAAGVSRRILNFDRKTLTKKRTR